MHYNSKPKSAPKGIAVHMLSLGHGSKDRKYFANNVHCTNISQAFHYIILFLPNLLSDYGNRMIENYNKCKNILDGYVKAL
jgi:hypothetical protein